MTLTHEQIAGMTCVEVNKEIAKRLDQYEEWDSMGSDNMDCPDVFEEFPDYSHDWSHAGWLLEMFDDFALSRRGNVSECSVFTERGDIDHFAPTAPEAIAHCWLEWWEVTHD